MSIVQRPLRIAVVDSGVHPGHPHILSLAGGATIGDSVEEGNFVDRIGHGTAVMAAIQERCPGAEYFAARVFTTGLRTRIEHLLAAMEWSLEREVHLINLSLGTVNPVHIPVFNTMLERCTARGITVISAAVAEGLPSIPGSLAGAVGVLPDAGCPRDAYRLEPSSPEPRYLASPYPRPIPNLPPERNLSGVSFAVANLTGIAGQLLLDHPGESLASLLAAHASR